MCGILAVFGNIDAATTAAADESSERMAHRGPDGRGLAINPGVGVLCHRRLAIMDPAQGHQPIYGPQGAAVVHNGEIYNYPTLAKELASAGCPCQTGSDSEVIAILYEAIGEACVALLDGIFAFAAFHGDDWLVARDPIGVKPLYWGRDAAGNLWFASELKALVDRCETFSEFPPGHLMTRRGGLKRWYKPAWMRDAPPLPGDPGTTPADAIDQFMIRMKHSLRDAREMLSNTVAFWMVQELADKEWNVGKVNIPGLTTGFPPGVPGYPTVTLK